VVAPHLSICPAPTACPAHGLDILLTAFFNEQYHVISWFNICMGCISTGCAETVTGCVPNINVPYWASNLVHFPELTNFHPGTYLFYRIQQFKLRLILILFIPVINIK